MTASIPENVSAEDFLIKVAGIYKHEMSEAEAFLWKTRVCSEYPGRAVIAALISHMESGTKEANFMPQYGAIKAMLNRSNGACDMNQLEILVRTGSPYAAPAVSDPKMVQIIHELGGWVRVCAEFPDMGLKPREYQAYSQRFEQALRSATTNVDVYGQIPAPIKALCLEAR